MRSLIVMVRIISMTVGKEDTYWKEVWQVSTDHFSNKQSKKRK